MRPLVIVSACLLAVLLSSCGPGATTNCRVPPDRALLLAVRAHAGPVKVGTGSDDPGNAGRLTITACQTSDTEATATLTVFGLSDDSTRDIRHGVRLAKRGSAWVVTADAHSRRCQEGRGSQEFSSAKCT